MGLPAIALVLFFEHSFSKHEFQWNIFLLKMLTTISKSSVFPGCSGRPTPNLAVLF